MTCKPTLRVNRDPSQHGPSSVSACCLGSDVVGFLANSSQPDQLLRSIFRVTVAQESSPEVGNLPSVSGHYHVLDDEVRFVPHFRFESDVKYRISFDLRHAAPSLRGEPSALEFLTPSEQETRTLTTVTHIYPSGECLPENLLRFYVCFSNPMNRGRALDQISLLDSEGQHVTDALYRPPVELWDRTMRNLTVLLDPGRLKRWVGPNAALGPPLKDGQKYMLEIGSGMIDLHGRPLSERFCKKFLVGNPIREQVGVEYWKILPPVTGSRGVLVLRFTRPLDWALTSRLIKVERADGSVIDGRVSVDQCETRWNFSPTSPWAAGIYQIRIGSGLEDVCGNNISGAFDRPFRKDLNAVADTNNCSLGFQLS
jgi:hypothetical protein